VTVDDGSGPVTERVTLPFEEGVWLHFPISVAPAGTVTVTVDRLSAAQAIVSGVFLGGGEGGGGIVIPA
jgi:hypothetical protein